MQEGLLYFHVVTSTWGKQNKNMQLLKVPEYLISYKTGSNFILI